MSCLNNYVWLVIPCFKYENSCGGVEEATYPDKWTSENLGQDLECRFLMQILRRIYNFSALLL
jgi:hypothetical protein